MKKTPLDDLKWRLTAARRRMMLQTFLGAVARGALGAAGVLVIAVTAARWRSERLPLEVELAAVLAAILSAVLFAAVFTIIRRQSLPEVAAIIDRLGRTHDRFLTALSFSREPARREMHDLALRECAEFAWKGHFDRLIRVRWPREAAWLLAPLTAVAMLQWEASITFKARDMETTEARAAVEDTAKKLEELARRTQEADAQMPSEELKTIAERLRRGAEQARTQATNPEDAAKAAMRELSTLEQLVQEMQRARAGAAPEELKALAAALAAHEATKEAAAALKQGDLDKAAAELEKSLQKMEESKSERTEEELRKLLEDAVKQMAAQKQLSNALQKLAQQMQRSPAGKGGPGSEAMRQLAQLLRQMQQGQGAPHAGGGGNAQTLQSLLAALQAMKYGESEKGGDSKSGQGKGNGLVTVQSFGGETPGAVPRGNPNMPSGQPGSERDEGTTDSAFGKDRQEPGKEAQAKQFAGRLGEGESLQQFVPSAGDSSKSNRRYKELYEAMAPAAEEAVLQENIPLGSRFFIKRYFEAIRPAE